MMINHIRYYNICVPFLYLDFIISVLDVSIYILLIFENLFRINFIILNIKLRLNLIIEFTII